MKHVGRKAFAVSADFSSVAELEEYGILQKREWRNLEVDLGDK